MALKFLPRERERERYRDREIEIERERERERAAAFEAIIRHNSFSNVVQSRLMASAFKLTREMLD